MTRALWRGTVLAESDRTQVVEGNYYFPPDSLHREFFKSSDMHTICPWKGVASYYTIEVDGKRNEDGAWYYPDPKEAAQQFRGWVAFWKGVEVQP